MKKFLIIFVLTIIGCGGTDDTSIQDTTTTTVEDTTTTTVEDTTTTTLKKSFLIEEFSFKTNSRDDPFPVGYLYAQVKSDILWDSFNIETLNENGNKCSYYLNDKQVDYSRLLFIPELGCEPGVYTVSKIEINYKDKQFSFNSENNQLEEIGNLICCNFEEAFNWRVEIGREINDNCKYGYISYRDVCIVSFPLIKYINLSEDRNNNIVIEYEFEPNESISENNLTLGLMFMFQSGNDRGDISIFIENTSEYGAGTIEGNPWKDSIVASKDPANTSENVAGTNNIKLNTKYRLVEIAIIFYEGYVNDMLCVGVINLHDSFELDYPNRGYRISGRDELCSFDRYETVAYTEKLKGALPFGEFDPNEWDETYYFETDLIFDFEFSR